ncbi:MAG TPA: ABC transporter ATP-binding protein [Planosporangium sp.]|jgi:ABC-2 type transport system ATP-binding protein|nr:ABC transporter ATP-binding protein [Planosporangium sp.]
MSVTYAVETHSLTKRYGSVPALVDCDLTVPAGRVVALVGPNGAGKTTLLRLVVGLIRPTSGTVKVLGEVSVADTPQALAKVGFVAQEHPLYRRFTVADLLRMGQALNLRWDQQFAEQRLRTLGIPAKQRAGSLSGGQQAQVALAMALAKRPQLLVLDEPLASLDPLARREFLQALMEAVAEYGITVVFSSHVVTELQRVCDYLVVINGGRLQLAGDIDEMLAGHRLLVGPRDGNQPVPPVEGVLSVTHGERHTNIVMRTGGEPVAPGWEAHSLELEDLVIAYLQQPATAVRESPAVTR